MRMASCVLGAALLVLLTWLPVARGDDTGPASYRAVIDRVELSPASIGGLRLRVELSALSLQGQVLDLGDPRSVKLMVGGSKLDVPSARGHYGQTGAETAIVFVLQANQAYAEVLPTILTSLDDAVLSRLGDRSQVAILAYGDTTESGKLGTIKAARARLGQLAQDGSASEPALLDTLDRAIRLLKKARAATPSAPLRKLLVVIGDGRDRAGDRERVTQLGVRAGRDGIRIHTFGFAPSNVRRPLLALGELSKRSLGTFRWVRTSGAESWGPALLQLRDEIQKQYVLTYFVPDAAVAGKRVKVVTVGRTEATSNELKIPEPACGGEACAGYCVDGVCATPRESAQRGVLGWLMLVIGVALAAAVVLGLIGYLLQKRQGAPGLPGHPGQRPAGPPHAHPAMPGFPGQLPAHPGQLPAGHLAAHAGQLPAGQLAAHAARPPAAAAPTAAVGPSLLVLTGPLTGQRIPLHHGFAIGKAPTCHLVLDDGYTSSQHAQIAVDAAGNCRLLDRNSTNGTFVNGVRVTDSVLQHGMSIRIGSIELRFLAQ